MYAVQSDAVSHRADAVRSIPRPSVSCHVIRPALSAVGVHHVQRHAENWGATVSHSGRARQHEKSGWSAILAKPRVCGPAGGPARAARAWCEWCGCPSGTGGSLAGAKIDPGILSSEPCPFLSVFLLLLPLIPNHRQAHSR